ncbi:MAG TPA: GDP-L-fucose synthase [Vitreimonas sp.]|nr:GDP-L-fucose synthase [Vitreimonas sp.]
MTDIIYPLRGKRVFVAGEHGMVGRALVRRLADSGCELLSAPRDALDLENQASVSAWFAANRPQAVFLAAAKVGGINANDTLPVDFLERNLRIAANAIHAAHKAKVEKLLFLGSSCIYPRDTRQPMTEEALLTGPLEPTNQWYAIAKIAGIKLCEAYRKQYGDDFVSVMPTNLYGPGDNYHPEHSHVPAALIRRFHEAKEGGAGDVVVWGTGAPRREFMHVDDMADGCVFVMERYSGAGMLNVGTGLDVTIAEFAALVAEVVGYKGKLTFDTTRPDGTPRKLLDVSKLAALGWRARIGLREGLADAYADFLKGGWREA